MLKTTWWKLSGWTIPRNLRVKWCPWKYTNQSLILLTTFWRCLNKWGNPRLVLSWKYWKNKEKREASRWDERKHAKLNLEKKKNIRRKLKIDKQKTRKQGTKKEIQHGEHIVSLHPETSSGYELYKLKHSSSRSCAKYVRSRSPPKCGRLPDFNHRKCSLFFFSPVRWSLFSYPQPHKPSFLFPFLCLFSRRPGFVEAVRSRIENSMLRSFHSDYWWDPFLSKTRQSVRKFWSF